MYFSNSARLTKRLSSGKKQKRWAKRARCWIKKSRPENCMNNKTLLLLVASLLAFFSCKKPPALISKDTGPITEAKPDTIQVAVDEIDFQYFSSKSKITYQDQN